MTNVANVIDFVKNWQGTYNNQGVLTHDETIRLARELQIKIAEMSFDPPTAGSKIIPYNGYIGDIPAWQTAEGASKSSGGKFIYISDLK